MHPTVIPLDVDPAGLRQLQARSPAAYPYLLQSIDASGNHWDILFLCPEETLILDSIDSATDFFDRIDAPLNHIDSELPFCGGWFLYLGYELASVFEPSLKLPEDNLPLAIAARVKHAILYSHASAQGYLCMEEGVSSVRQVVESDLERLSPLAPEVLKLDEIIEAPPETYLRGVETIKQAIRRGDVYQVNLSRPWTAQLPANIKSSTIYDQLCRANPAPFAGMACFEGFDIISSSPERLVRVEQGRVETRPIAGTHPRGASEAEDQQIQAQLLAHPKEQAEHIMLLDLERNDLGRICEIGSVQVNEHMVLESYAHVHHLVSNVEGRLRPDVKRSEIIAATFPGGTITGCPKVKCMEIIASLEQSPRGPYTGSMGYISANDKMDLNILIRSFIRRGNELSFRAGAGIVADSQAQRELEETRHKARGLVKGLGL